MMLDHDSPLVQPSAAPDIAPESTVEPLPRLSEVPQPPPLRRIDLVFEQKGSLGIEFKELAAPFVIEQVHSTGLAYNRDLQKGDQLILVGGEDVTQLAWDELVQKLGPRPVLVTFERPDAVEEEPAPTSFMSGFGSTMRSLGGSVMEQGLDLGKMGIAGGLEIGTKGLELGSKLSSAGMGFGNKDTTTGAPTPTENGMQDNPQQDLGQSQEAERLQLEVRRLLRFEEASRELEARLKEAELQLEQRSQALTELERQRAADATAIQGLKGDLASIQETGVSQAGQLESALRERDEAQQKLQEAMQRSQENLQAADAVRAFSTENETLQQELVQSREASKELQARLKEVELQLEQRSQAITALEHRRAADAPEPETFFIGDDENTQGDLSSMEDASAAQAQQLESALRERDEAQQKLQELLERSQENLQAADASHALSTENETLQQELAQSREASKELQARLQEAELQLEQRSQAMTALEQHRAADASTIQRLQGDLSSIQGTGAQQLESALRERDEAQQKLQEVLQKSQENLQAADASRTLSMENEALQQDLAQSREASKELQSRLQEAELQLEQRSQAIAELEQLRVADSTAVQRLQGDLASIQETGASQAGQLESALRERDEAQQKLQELLQKSQETDQVADASRALSTENENLRQELVQSKQATTDAEARLQEVTQQLHQFGQAITHFQSQHQADAARIQQLQGDLASTQEAGASQAGQLELALRERNEANQRLQEVLQRSQETSQVANAGSTENERLRQELAQSREELMRCVAKLQDAERLQLEIRRLLPFEEASKELETRLREAELQLEQRSQAMTELQRQHAADAASIQRLQGDLLSIQETGESQAGQLESALLERNKECATLRRERNEAQQKLQEVLQRSQENLQVADAGRALSTENERLQQELAQSQEELKSLNSVVERCVAKMEAESRERPFLVDKRMVTQMLAAYLEQRENPGPQLEILNKMADLLGFTSAEREQVGLSQKRKTPLQMQEPQGLADLTDRFVDFLMEESEAG